MRMNDNLKENDKQFRKEVNNLEEVGAECTRQVWKNARMLLTKKEVCKRWREYLKRADWR